MVAQAVTRRAFLTRATAVAGGLLAVGSLPPAAGTWAAGPARAQGGDSRILAAADIAEIKAKVAEQPWARDAFAALKRAADGLVRDLPPIPDQGGGWFHAGGPAYEITRVHNRLAEGVRTLGLVYRLSGDGQYAEAARRILLGYAARYRGYELHDNQGRTGAQARSGGKVLSQGLDEGIWLGMVAYGHDLVRDAVPDADREAIATGVLRPAAELLMGYNVGRHNHQTYFNLGIGLAGFAIDEPRFVEHAILKPDSGLLFQLSPGASYTADGFWYEGSAHYHAYALEGILGLAEAAQRNGYEPYASASLKGAFDFPLAYADAAGRLPAFNDGPPASLYEPWRARQYEVGYRRYGDPRYAALLARVGRGSGIHGLVYGVPALPETDPFEPGRGPSAVLADGTLPVLRAGPGERRLQLALNGMPYVGGHSQPAQLEVELASPAARLVPAPASIKYADPLYPGWYRQTVSHSTVVVDGASQGRGQPAELGTFHAGALFQAARLRTRSAYPGALLDRTCLLLDIGMVDLFHVRTPAESTLDWVLHHDGRLAVEVETQARRAPPLPGYQELDDVAEGRIDGDWRARWTLADGSTSSLWVAGAPGTVVLHGRGYVGAPDQNNAPDQVSALLVRRRASAAAFVAVLLPGDDGTAAVTPLPATRDGAPVGADAALGLLIRADGVAYEVLLTPDPSPAEVGGRAVAGGQIVVIRTDRGGTVEVEQAPLA